MIDNFYLLSSDSLLNQNQEKIEIIRREKYSPDNIFKNSSNNVINNVTEELSLEKRKEAKWYKKI